MIFAPHLAGCSCAGFYVPLDPASVEEDLLDFLAYRYRSEKLDTLADYVARRMADRSTGFEKWLSGLDAAPVGQAERNRLKDDLRNTLESMNTARPAKAGFVCY